MIENFDDYVVLDELRMKSFTAVTCFVTFANILKV